MSAEHQDFFSFTCFFDSPLAHKLNIHKYISDVYLRYLLLSHDICIYLQRISQRVKLSALTHTAVKRAFLLYFLNVCH